MFKGKEKFLSVIYFLTYLLVAAITKFVKDNHSKSFPQLKGKYSNEANKAKYVM